MKIIRALCHVFVWICMLCTAAMMLLMVSEVLSRWLFNRAILGSTEWAQVLLCCTMSSFGAAILCNRMTKVDILTSHLKPKAQVILEQEPEEGVVLVPSSTKLKAAFVLSEAVRI